MPEATSTMPAASLHDNDRDELRATAQELGIASALIADALAMLFTLPHAEAAEAEALRRVPIRVPLRLLQAVRRDVEEAAARLDAIWQATAPAERRA